MTYPSLSLTESVSFNAFEDGRKGVIARTFAAVMVSFGGVLIAMCAVSLGMQALTTHIFNSVTTANSPGAAMATGAVGIALCYVGCGMWTDLRAASGLSIVFTSIMLLYLVARISSPISWIGGIVGAITLVAGVVLLAQERSRNGSIRSYNADEARMAAPQPLADETASFEKSLFGLQARLEQGRSAAEPVKEKEEELALAGGSADHSQRS